jgi:glutaredoxin 3
MRPVTVYTDEICTLCHSVENLLNVREIPYEKVMITPGSDEHEKLVERSGGYTGLPQVYIGSRLLGGYQETLAADQAGMLADLLVD